MLTAVTRELRSSVTCVGVVAMCIPLKCTIQPSPASACGQLANALISGLCNTDKVYTTLCAVVQSTTRKLPRRARLARCQVRCALTASQHDATQHVTNTIRTYARTHTCTTCEMVQTTASRLGLTVDPEVLEEEHRQNVGHGGGRGRVAAAGGGEAPFNQATLHGLTNLAAVSWSRPPAHPELAARVQVMLWILILFATSLRSWTRPADNGL